MKSIKRNLGIFIALTLLLGTILSINSSAAGTAKPINATYVEGTWSVIGALGNGTTNSTGLFNGSCENDYSPGHGMYWYTSGVDYIEIEVGSPSFRIWRSGTTSWPNSFAKFITYQWDGSNYIDISQSQPATTNITNDSWELMTATLPAGKYKFVPGGSRIDSEWFIEAVGNTSTPIPKSTGFSQPAAAGSNSNFSVIGGVNNSNNSWDEFTNNGLFNASATNEYTPPYGWYWGSSADYIEIQVDNTFRIWRSGTTTWSDSCAKLTTKQWNGSSYVDITSTQPNTTPTTNGTWEVFTTVLPAGTYRFENYANTFRIDSEWYIENMDSVATPTPTPDAPTPTPETTPTPSPDTPTPTPETTPTPSPDTPTPTPISGSNAIVEITMVNGFVNEFDLTSTELQSFTDWYDARSSGTGKSYFTFIRKNSIKPFLSRKISIAFDKILSFEVKEYNN
jgi:hypothetical protein